MDNQNKNNNNVYPQRRTVPLRGSNNIHTSPAATLPERKTIPQRPAQRRPVNQVPDAVNRKPEHTAPSKRRLSREEIEILRKQQQQREAENRRKAALKKRNRKIAIAFIVLFLLVFIITKLIISIGGNDEREKYEIAEKPKETESLEKTTPEITNTTTSTVSYPKTDGTEAQLNIDSQYGILISLSDNKVLATKGGTEKIYPASMTKIMTLICAVESINDLENTTFTFNAEMLSGFYDDNATVAGFKAGETVSIKDMLYGLILPSGADAAAGIAQCVSGSEGAFVELMNATVKRIGLVNTHFTNPVGLHDENMYSTCMDMAVILEYAIQNPTCLEILSAYQYTTAKTEQNPEGIALTSTLFSRMEGGEPETARVYAGKTGYTIEGANCLATYAKSNSDSKGYIMVTAKGSSIWKPIFDAINTYKEFIE